MDITMEARKAKVKDMAAKKEDLTIIIIITMDMEKVMAVRRAVTTMEARREARKDITSTIANVWMMAKEKVTVVRKEVRKEAVITVVRREGKEVRKVGAKEGTGPIPIPHPLNSGTTMLPLNIGKTTLRLLLAALLAATGAIGVPMDG